MIGVDPPTRGVSVAAALFSLVAFSGLSIWILARKVRAYEIVDNRRYLKDDLPLDDVFRRDGDEVLTLITCGGAFDSITRAYEDNVVAVAVPV